MTLMMLFVVKCNKRRRGLGFDTGNDKRALGGRAMEVEQSDEDIYMQLHYITVGEQSESVRARVRR